jgi:hypothetical protein
MFHECEKCKRRWSYPLPECPYCFVPLKKIAGEKAVVRGAAKVNISTLFHPNVPYYVFVLEDEFGNFWSYKSEEERVLGDEFKIKANSDPGAVAVWRVKYDHQEAIEKALDLIGGAGIGADSKIVVLPTLEKASHSYFRDNTSPEFLSAVLELLAGKGVKNENIIVAGQSFGDLSLGNLGTAAAGGSPAPAMAQKSGLVAACQKFGIVPCDLAEGEFEKRGQFEISKKVLDADLTINLAMEKMGRAGATENMFRVLKKENYLGRIYLSSEAEIFAALSPLLPNAITIGEAEFVQRPNKIAVFMGLVLASKNAVNLDRVFNEIAQSAKMPEIIKNIPAGGIPIAGRSIREVQYQAEIF